MQRADYQALDRTTRIVAYGTSWLERQDNVKTIHEGGARVPLARETGKNWYVRLPDVECAAAQAFARPRQAFWALLARPGTACCAAGRPSWRRRCPGSHRAS